MNGTSPTNITNLLKSRFASQPDVWKACEKSIALGVRNERILLAFNRIYGNDPTQRQTDVIKKVADEFHVSTSTVHQVIYGTKSTTKKTTAKKDDKDQA